MKRTHANSLILIVVVLAVFAAPLSAGILHPSYSRHTESDTVSFYPGGTYLLAVPAPNDYLRYPVGQWPLRYHELASYIELLAGKTDRMIYKVHGRSHEGRELFNLFISSPENLKNLESIRERMDLLADSRLIKSDRQTDSLINGLPAVAWLGYSIHGDELSGVDAAIRLVYQLCAGTDEATLKLLDNLIIIIDPIENPDGRERYMSMIETYRSHVPNYDRRSLQHSGVWPWGRGNHYLFDLNRDWILLNQPETHGRAATIVKWHPQMVVDAHEMGANATYLFSPPRQPINYNTPGNVAKWYDRFNKDQSRAFDQRGWPYYAGEWNEQWYPGYGSAWPTFSGAVGILYEQAGVDGQFVKQRDDYLLTYHESVNHQFTSSIANLTTLSDNREEIIRDYYLARKKIVDQGEKSGLKFLFVPDGDQLKVKRFIESLVQQGIEVRRAGSSFTVGSCSDIYHNEHSSKKMPEGTFIVSTAQPTGALAKAVLEFDAHLKLEFLKEERRELEKHGDTKMYEISSWSVPLAYDLDAYYTTSSITVATEPVTEIALPTGKLINADASYGFIIDMEGEKTYRILGRLFDEGLTLFASEKPFTLEGRNYKAGAIAIRQRGNRKDLPDLLDRLAAEIGINVYGVGTGRATEGSYLGAGTFRQLQQPKIAIVGGDGTSYTSFGSLWFTIDKQLELPHSVLNLPTLGWTDLSEYNVLVLPSSWGSMGQKLGKGGENKLKEWVSNGGTLILMGQSAVWAADSSTGLSAVRLKRQSLEKFTEYDKALEREQNAEAPEVDTMALWHPGKVAKDDKKEEKEKPSWPGNDEAKDLDQWQRKFRPGGSILRANLATEDWLAFGMKPSVPVMVYTDYAFLASKPVSVTARFADENDLRVSGLLWPEARTRWANTAYATHERKGAGQIVMFAGDPNMRAYFYGTRAMFVNALLYGPGMGSSFEGPYEAEGLQ